MWNKVPFFDYIYIYILINHNWNFLKGVRKSWETIIFLSMLFGWQERGIIKKAQRI
jgi:high-affinity Fe2+/Pb2+ permease